MTRVVKTKGKVREEAREILQDLGLIGMARHLFKWPKHSHWNIKCGDTEYVHWSSHKYPIGYGIFRWSEHWWHGYGNAHQNYQKKLVKVKKLVDIITSAIGIFETSISKVLNNGEIDEWEFQVLQELHLKVINKSNVDHKMELETRNQLQKSLLEEISG